MRDAPPFEGLRKFPAVGSKERNKWVTRGCKEPPKSWGHCLPCSTQVWSLVNFCVPAPKCPGLRSAEEPLPGHRWLNGNDGVGRELCLEPDPGTTKSKARLLVLACGHKQWCFYFFFFSLYNESLTTKIYTCVRMLQCKRKKKSLLYLF